MVGNRKECFMSSSTSPNEGAEVRPNHGKPWFDLQ